MERAAWTDERIDDLATTLDQNIGLLRDEIRGLRDDNREKLRSLRGDFSALRSDLSAGQRQIAHIGWALATGLVGAVVALVVAVA